MGCHLISTYSAVVLVWCQWNLREQVNNQGRVPVYLPSSVLGGDKNGHERRSRAAISLQPSFVNTASSEATRQPYLGWPVSPDFLLWYCTRQQTYSTTRPSPRPLQLFLLLNSEPLGLSIHLCGGPECARNARRCIEDRVAGGGEKGNGGCLR